MGRFSSPLADLVIPNGQTVSNELTARNDYGDSTAITIYAPATLPEAVRIQVSPIGNPVAADWRDLDEGAGDVVIAAGQARKLEFQGFGAIRLLAGVAVAAERRFSVSKSF